MTKKIKNSVGLVRVIVSEIEGRIAEIYEVHTPKATHHFDYNQFLNWVREEDSLSMYEIAYNLKFRFHLRKWLDTLWDMGHINQNQNK